LASNAGSFDSLKVRTRCGLISLARHSRCTVAFETPMAWAIVRTLQRGRPGGGRVARLPISPWVADAIDGLLDEPRRGTPRTIDVAKVESVIVQTLESQPQGLPTGGTRSMAPHSGISTSSVGRIWRAFGLQPHRVETFKLSTDPLFVDKVRDIVGLYLNPPDRAMVLCVDEKSLSCCCQCGRAKSSGAAMITSGTPQPHCSPPWTSPPAGSSDAATSVTARSNFASSWPRSPAELDIHLVLENYGTHKAPVRAWLARHPRYHLHFTPTSASWLNQVERWFALLADKRIKRGVHRSVHQLKAAIAAFI
jgi:hypothetical protein